MNRFVNSPAISVEYNRSNVTLTGVKICVQGESPRRVTYFEMVSFLMSVTEKHLSMIEIFSPRRPPYGSEVKVDFYFWSEYHAEDPQSIVNKMEAWKEN